MDELVLLDDGDGGDILPTPVLRFLAVNSTGKSMALIPPLKDTEVLNKTIEVYGTLFAVLFLIFLVARAAYPGVYNLKATYEHLRIPLAADPFGPLSWTWCVFAVPYEVIAEQCGMDAVTTIRLLEFGAKLSAVACVNSFYLLPIYKYVGSVVEDDPVKEHSLANLPQRHPGSIATAVAAHLFLRCDAFFQKMSVDKDFEFFTEHRHKFLAKRRVQNYSIFLSNLPKDMQSDTAIQDYFRDCFGHDKVVDGDVALHIPKLKALNKKRETLIAKFEHAINVKVVAKRESTHRTKVCGGKKVESIPAYEKELEDLNTEISATIEKIVADKESRRAGKEKDAKNCKSRARFRDDDPAGDEAPTPDEEVGGLASTEVENTNQDKAPILNEEYDVPHSFSGDVSRKLSHIKTKVMKDEVDVSHRLSQIKTMVISDEGSACSAAFVSFADLVSANTSLQSVHNAEPWNMKADSAPRPDLVNWANVGLNNKVKQTGELISLGLTTGLCFFWTIPVTFVASFSNVEGLAKLIPGLEEVLANNTQLSQVLAQLAPLILVAFIKLLPFILLFFVKFERPIEKLSFQHPSLLSKLAAFTIIQTFFISTLSGSLIDQLKDILESPQLAFEYVSRGLVGRSAFFIQLIIVQNFLGLGVEILRPAPIVQEWLGTLIKKIAGYGLTEKEQNMSFMGIRDMADPLEYFFARELGTKTILLLMILYVYSAIAPITAYFTLAIFSASAGCLRNQFIFIYPIANDSGGKLWLNFTKTSVTCMIVAEIVLCAILLFKEDLIAGALIVPLITITFLFQKYFNKRHYMVTNFLPLGDCTAIDKKNKEEGMTYEWLEDAYLQPAMKDRRKYPCIYDEVRGTGLSAQGTQGAGLDMCSITDGRSQGNISVEGNTEEAP